MPVLFFAVLLQDYWISELASDDIERRDRATQILLSKGRWDPLYAARESTGDSEVRARLDLILRALWKSVCYGVGLPGTSIRWTWSDGFSRYEATLSAGVLQVTDIDRPEALCRPVGLEIVRLAMLARESGFFEIDAPRGVAIYKGSAVEPEPGWSVTYRSVLGLRRHIAGTGMLWAGQWPFFDELRNLAVRAMAEEARRKEIDRWVEDLGSESIDVRDAASQQLIKAGAAALPALRGSSDFEVQNVRKAIRKSIRYGIGLPDTCLMVFSPFFKLWLAGDGRMLVFVDDGEDFRPVQRIPASRVAMDFDLLDFPEPSPVELPPEIGPRCFGSPWKVMYRSASGEFRTWSGTGDPPKKLAQLIQTLRGIVRRK